MDLSLENLAHLTQILQVICPPVGHEIGCLTNIQNNMGTLVKEAELLKRKREDIEADGEEATRKRIRLTNHDGNWLQEVRNSIFEIDSMKSEFDNSEAMSSWSCTKYWSRYLLGRRINKMLKAAKDLNERGVFTAISSPRVLEMPLSRTMHGQSTFKQTTHKIWAHLHDEHSQIIGVCGLAGVGKTTLMKIINNRLIGTQDFDIVIWITVSKAFDLQKIQKKIMERLDLKFEENDDEERRRAQVQDALKSTRFLLILDELWQAIDLDQIGIPKPDMQNRSKIAVVTKSLEVSNDMGADVVIRVNTLKEVEAWNLFLENVGKVALQPDIQQLAKEVVMECNGLPLRIITVGRAMKGKKEIDLWQNALRTLKESAPEIGGMESGVFPALKLSYDHLNDEKIKDCFLYCSLYPEDYEIDIEELVKLWVAEGLIDGDLAAASCKGYDILDRIEDACLLEGGHNGDKHFVKMHHLVRDMALEIASLTFNGGPRFMVRAGVGLTEPPREEMQRGNVRISLMRIEITSIPFKPDCTDLVSLFLSGNHCLTTIHSNFFEGMPNLSALDLSSTAIKALPASIGSLLNLHFLSLRKCKQIRKAQYLGEIKTLRFLDLSHSGVRMFPQGIKKLKLLTALNMSHMKFLSMIPDNVITALCDLEELRLFGTSINWAKPSMLKDEKKGTLSEVVTLKRLRTLKITIFDIDCVAQDVFHQQWSTLNNIKISIGPNSSSEISLPCAKQVHISGSGRRVDGVKAMLTHTEGVFLNGTDISLSHLVGNSKSLKMTRIEDCNKMESVINWGNVEDGALQNIEELCLYEIPELKKLFEGEVPQYLRKLTKIVVHQCNSLKYLFSSEMVQYLDHLELLYVTDCEDLEEIMEGDESHPDNPLPRLCSLILFKLGKLRSIIPYSSVSLPSLREFFIDSCPRLILPDRPSITKIQESAHGSQMVPMPPHRYR